MTDDAELAALHAIASLASGPDDPAAGAREILALISSALESECGMVAFQNPESGKLEVEAGLGLPSDAELSFAPGQGVPGWVAWHAKPVLVPDSSADLRSKPLRRDTRCEMAAPLLAPDGRIQGGIALERDLPGLGETRHLRGKERQLEALIATGQALVGKLEQRELFDTLTRDAAAMLQARTCAFFLHDPGSSILRLASYTAECGAFSPGGA